MDNINYHWLETEEERRFVLDRILSLFQHRKPTGLETVETMAERVFEDEDINSAEKALRGFPHICTTIWRDDLFSSETYARALRSMLEIAPSMRAIIDIEDGSTDTVKGDEFDVSVLCGGQEHRVTLRHQRFLDYNFLKLIPPLLEISCAPGKYYSVYSESVEEGFVFTYLDPDEYSDVMSSEMFGLNELNSKVIEDIISVYNAVEVPKAKVITPQEVLDNNDNSATEDNVKGDIFTDENLKVQIHIQGIGAAHEAEHGYREANLDPDMTLEKFIRFALGFKGSFLETEYDMMASKQLCAVIRRTSSGAEIISKKNIRLKGLVIEGKPLKVSFGINKLNDAVIDYRMKLLIEKGVKHLDDVEAAWLGVLPGTDINNFPDRLAGYPAIQAVLRDHKSAKEAPEEEPEKVHWMYKLWSALRYIKLIIMPFR